MKIVYSIGTFTVDISVPSEGYTFPVSKTTTLSLSDSQP